MRRILSFPLWFICAGILFVFIILPDLVTTSTGSLEQYNWFLRLFYGVFLCNPFFGAARAFTKPGALGNYFNKYRNSDKDTLVISIYIIGFVFTLVPMFVMFMALSGFYPMLGWLNYLFTLLYGVLVAVAQYYFSKMKLDRLNDNIAHEK